MNERGFTLLEMLCGTAIICVLCTLLLYGGRSCLDRARVAEDAAVSRRIFQAYISAANDQNGVLPKGRYGENEAPDVTLPDGSSLRQKSGHVVVLQRYPWHLAPYLDWNVEKAFVTWANRKEFQEMAKFASGMSSQYYYNVSVMPAFGQNAYGVGGYETSAYSEAVTRLGSAPEPSKLIAFVSSRDANTKGYPYVIPPRSGQMSVYFDGSTGVRQTSWPGSAYAASQAAGFGYIALNHGERAMTVFLDGHSALMSLDELRDSRHWSRVAQEKNDPSHVVLR